MCYLPLPQKFQVFTPPHRQRYKMSSILLERKGFSKFWCTFSILLSKQFNQRFMYTRRIPFFDKTTKTMVPLLAKILQCKIKRRLLSHNKYLFCYFCLHLKLNLPLNYPYFCHELYHYFCNFREIGWKSRAIMVNFYRKVTNIQKLNLEKWKTYIRKNR